MRVPRKNYELNDAIEVLQEHFVNCGNDVQRAWAELSPDALKFVETEVDRALDLRYYLENYHLIKSEHGVQKTLYPFWDHQEIVYEAIQEEWQEKGCCKIIVLKPRQTGISVWTAASMLHRTITTPHCFTMIVAQNDDTSEYIYQMSLNAYANLPWWLRPEWMYKTKNGGIEFQRKDEKQRMTDPGLGSGLQVSAATKTSGVAIGRSIRALHACLTKENLVFNERGYLVSIADVRVGQTVLSNGKPVKVTAFSEKPSREVFDGAENGYRITPWGSPAFSIIGTGNHQILCQERVARAGMRWEPIPLGVLKIGRKFYAPPAMKDFSSINASDKVCIPVRPITETGNIPIGGTNGYRKHGGGTLSTWTPPQPSRDFGFAVGLYLAEGSVNRRLVISLGPNERHLADRFSRAVGVPYTENFSKTSKTERYCFNRTSIAKWFSENVGEKDEKRIPQWAWSVGRDFLLGVVEGMILGDGHRNKKAAITSFTSTRPQLACGIRDAGLSLGFGYSGIYSREAGFHYGRNCQKIYTTRFCQISDVLMRTEYEWPRSSWKSIRETAHWAYSPDKSYVSVSIRSIQREEIDVVYDIEVDSEDHTFSLPGAMTHNSEVSRWPNDEVFEGDIKPSMNAMDTYQVFESTGYGRNGLFYEQWCAAEDGDNDMRAVWIPVYKVKKYYKAPDKTFELADDERNFNERVKKDEKFDIPDAFWCFRRERMRAAKRSGTKAGFLESYPLTPTEAFQSSGLCAFDRDSLEWQEINKVRKPMFAGEITLISVDPPRVNTDDIAVVEDGEILPRRKSGRGGKRFHIWEMPERGSTYYVSADVALGNGGDYSVAIVWRAGHGIEPDTMVASWWGWIPPKKYAHTIAAIGIFYNNAEVAVEYMKDGITTGNELRDMDYPNLYRPQFKDRLTHQASNYLHWLTNSKTRDEIIGCMNEALLDRTVVMRDADLLDECIDFAAMETGGRAEGQGNSDDGCMASMIGLYCLRETTKHLKTSAAKEAQRDTGELHVYGVYDNLMRQRGQHNTQAEADAMVKGKPGWRVVPILVCNANTLFSPIFDAMGAESELYSKHGMHSTQILPDVVYAFRNATQAAGRASDEYNNDW